MKLRFRKNSVRLRFTQGEVRQLAQGKFLEESVTFPGGHSLSYGLSTSSRNVAQATFDNCKLRIEIPSSDLQTWATGEEVGLYYELATTTQPLRLAIEKDLECIDGPAEERDVDAFPRRLAGKNC